jgi:SRSO17 transposase
MTKKNRTTKRRAVRQPPASGRKPSRKLSSRDVALSMKLLQDYHRDFQALFQRREQREWSFFYLCGQLANLERKTVEAMVLGLVGVEPNLIRALQQFMSEGAWNTQPLIEHLQSLVAQWLGVFDGVLIVDGSGFPKQGETSVGVAHQYCGHLGKRANCQHGVFLAYAGRGGSALLDERLYMPKSWFEAEHQRLRQRCGVPADLAFQTELALGLEMIQGVVQRAIVPFRWVTFDETYGRSAAFLEQIATWKKWYVAEVPADTRVWLRTPVVEPPGPGLFGHMRLHPRVRDTEPAPQEMRDLLPHLTSARWRRQVIKEGTKGPLAVETIVLRVTPVQNKLPGERCWAIFQRTLGPEPEFKFFLSNAPTTCPQTELLRVCGIRWAIETNFEEGKGEIGLDHHQMRSWRGWHHHMVQSFLAHLYLIRLRMLFQKKSGVDHRPSPAVSRTGDRGRLGKPTRRAGHPSLSAVPEPRRLSLAPQTNDCTARPKVCWPAQNWQKVEVSYS